MNNLKALKERLQIAQNSSTECYDFNEAIEDAIYSTDLTEAALESWLVSWSSDFTLLAEKDYHRGVQFVQDVWNEIIKGEEG